MIDLQYPVDLEEDEDGFTTVHFPDFPEAHTCGKGLDDILTQATDCLEEALFCRLMEQEPIPLPSPARDRHMVGPCTILAAKAALLISMKEAGMTKAALAQKLNLHEQEMTRLLNPKHPTKIGRLEEALAIFGKRLAVSVVAQV